MLFSCFEAFLGKFTENFYFSQKIDYLRKEHRYTQKFVFLINFEKDNSEENLDLFKQLFLIKPVKGDKY